VVNKEAALALLASFQAEHDFADQPPSDVIEFAKCLGWEAEKEEVTGSLAPWNGESLIGEFLEKLELDWDISGRHDNDVATRHLDRVGLALKYNYAWAIVSSMLFLRSDLPTELLLESSNDLECSVLLSKERYFKQAFQVLRNYCEICVSIMYFGRNRKKYNEWLSDPEKWFFPNYHEMLDELGKNLENREIGYLNNCYSKLNHSVHSKRKRLNMNLHRLERASGDFYLSDTVEWAKQFIRIVRFMTNLYIRKFFE